MTNRLDQVTHDRHSPYFESNKLPAAKVHEVVEILTCMFDPPGMACHLVSQRDLVTNQNFAYRYGVVTMFAYEC